MAITQPPKVKRNSILLQSYAKIQHVQSNFDVSKHRKRGKSLPRRRQSHAASPCPTRKSGRCCDPDLHGWGFVLPEPTEITEIQWIDD